MEISGIRLVLTSMVKLLMIGLEFRHYRVMAGLLRLVPITMMEMEVIQVMSGLSAEWIQLGANWWRY